MCRINVLWGCLLGLLVAGCGGGEGGISAPKLAPVEGVVYFNGQPLPNASLAFYPEKGPAGVAIADASGKFKVKTNGSNGAPIGTCLVTVSDGSKPDEEPPPADGNEMQLLKKRTLPAKYSSKDTTDLVVEVIEGGVTDLKLDLD
jgi:hypothetical protein